MSIRTFLIAFALISGIVFTGCKKDDPIAKPVIKILELGEGHSHGNNHKAVIGGDLHMEVEVVAEGKIDKIHVSLHPEGGSTGWELDTIYTKFAGLKNTEFHEHVEIDTAAQAGDYHFHFEVTDMEGNQSSAEAEIEIVEN